MAEVKLPYVSAYGNIEKTLNGMKAASTPDRFTQDFLSTKLGIGGGSGRPIIPFLKRIGFLSSDGSPTPLYRRFRNDATSGAAVAEAMRSGYKPLFEINEYVHQLSDQELRGLIVQATGFEDKSKTVGAITGSFKTLKKFADFDASRDADYDEGDTDRREPLQTPQVPPGLSVGYTINLHLPATSDIAVFNAIFKSLREHLLKGSSYDDS